MDDKQITVTVRDEGQQEFLKQFIVAGTQDSIPFEFGIAVGSGRLLVEANDVTKSISIPELVQKTLEVK